MADKIKFVLALLFLLAGIAGFYLLSDQPAVFRVLSVLAGLGFCIALGLHSSPGRRFRDFARDAIIETRKVVWPSRLETFQMTGVVFVFVVVVSIFLWLVDKTLEWVIYGQFLGWR